MNKIYAIIGPHASGKTSIMNILMNQGVPYITGHTTRNKRINEIDGREYHFISKTDFLSLDLVEKVSYQGDYYGITKEELLKKLQDCKICVLTTDLNGFKQLKKLFNNRIESIYLMVDYVTMVERMLALGENNDTIKLQLEYAEKNNEFELYKMTDYVIKNTGSIDVAVNQILAIMGLLTRK